jgi:ribonuclease J
LPVGGGFEIGPFKVEMVHVTHSIPESHMLAITTAQGTIVHTGDWKIDPDPLLGELTDKKRLTELGKKGVMAVIGDSTNATVPGRSGSELSVQECFQRIFKKFKRRIVITCFASNIARLKGIAQASRQSGRYVGLVGRSLWRNAEIAHDCGYLPEFSEFLSEDELAQSPREKVVLISTGCQGEPRSALARIAINDHPTIDLEKGDTVIFSSRDIPGNEKSIARVQNLLVEQGLDILTIEDDHVHVSGHPAQDELIEMYQMLRPKLIVPVHGEARHQLAHVEIAKKCQVQATFIPANGQIIRLTPSGAEPVDTVHSGQLGLDGTVLRAVDRGAVKDRRKISHTGVVVVTLALDHRGQLTNNPMVSMFGMADDDEALVTLKEDVSMAVEAALDEMPKSAKMDDNAVRHNAGIAVRRYINEFQGKKPVTEIHVVRV